MKPYRPNVELEKRRYSLRFTLERLRTQRKSVSRSGIRDNSEPWIENPRSLADATHISDSIEKAANYWRLKK